MKTIRSSYLASAAIIGLLALPAAALAQPAPSAPPAVASSPMTSRPIPGKRMEERVESHIKQLYAQLHITPAEYRGPSDTVALPWRRSPGLVGSSSRRGHRAGC